MLHWQDEGIVLAVRHHGESSAVVSLMTQEHGRHAGLVRGGTSLRARGLLQLGNQVQASWRARLPEHLGNLACELVAAHAARLFDASMRLAMLASAAALLETVLPEREPHRQVYGALLGLIAMLEAESDDLQAAAHYVRWELALLADLGFGLDLASCAASGRRDNLRYVSPRTGRALSAEALSGYGEAPWRARLLNLPAFLTDPAAEPDSGAIAAGLRLGGHFLRTHVLHERPLPGARERLSGLLARRFDSRPERQ